MHCHSFPAIAAPDAKILILGTMPGKRSLQERQYYAHPQNGFWGITAEILGFDVASAYPVRVQHLKAHHVALWDVLKSCTRESSLDSDIDPATIVPNDLAHFFARHRQIRRVCFNGAKAASLYARHVRPHLAAEVEVELIQLPSTSPANARTARLDKLQAWRVIKSETGTPDAHR